MAAAVREVAVAVAVVAVAVAVTDKEGLIRETRLSPRRVAVSAVPGSIWMRDHEEEDSDEPDNVLCLAENDEEEGSSTTFVMGAPALRPGDVTRGEVLAGAVSGLVGGHFSPAALLSCTILTPEGGPLGAPLAPMVRDKEFAGTIITWTPPDWRPGGPRAGPEPDTNLSKASLTLTPLAPEAPGIACFPRGAETPATAGAGADDVHDADAETAGVGGRILRGAASTGTGDAEAGTALDPELTAKALLRVTTAGGNAAAAGTSGHFPAAAAPLCGPRRRAIASAFDEGGGHMVNTASARLAGFMTDPVPGVAGFVTDPLPASAGLVTNTVPGFAGFVTDPLPASTGVVTNIVPGSIGFVTNTEPGPIGTTCLVMDIVLVSTGFAMDLVPRSTGFVTDTRPGTAGFVTTDTGPDTAGFVTTDTGPGTAGFVTTDTESGPAGFVTTDTVARDASDEREEGCPVALGADTEPAAAGPPRSPGSPTSTRQGAPPPSAEVGTSTA